MERSYDTVTSGDDGAIASSRYPTSAHLVAAIHRGDEAAMRELFILYAPLLRDQARRMNIDGGDRDEIVTTLLDDVVLHLVENSVTPRDLSRYLVAALRNRVRNRHRSVRLHELKLEGAYSVARVAGERIVAECHSEYGMRASGGTTEDPPPLRSAIVKLAARSAAELRREELTMMIAVGRHVPLRDVADQLGITYAAARVRLHRLRARFTRLATQFMSILDEREQREIERFFRRAEVPLTLGAVRQPVLKSGKGTGRGDAPPESTNGKI